MQYIVNNLKETQKLAKRFAFSLNGGEVILLSGDLGSGKTTFVREVLKVLGFKGVVTSPTFTIMQQYHVKKFTIYHFDLYRMESATEAYNFGLEDYIYARDINSIVFVEWPEKAKKMMKGDFVVINIEKISDNARSFSFSYEKR